MINIRVPVLESSTVGRKKTQCTLRDVRHEDRSCLVAPSHACVGRHESRLEQEGCLSSLQFIKKNVTNHFQVKESEHHGASGGLGEGFLISTLSK